MKPNEAPVLPDDAFFETGLRIWHSSHCFAETPVHLIPLPLCTSHTTAYSKKAICSLHSHEDLPWQVSLQQGRFVFRGHLFGYCL